MENDLPDPAASADTHHHDSETWDQPYPLRTRLTTATCASAAGRAAAAAGQLHQRYRAAAEALTPRQQQALVRSHLWIVAGRRRRPGRPAI